MGHANPWRIRQPLGTWNPLKSPVREAHKDSHFQALKGEKDD